LRLAKALGSVAGLSPSGGETPGFADRPRGRGAVVDKEMTCWVSFTDALRMSLRRVLTVP